MSDAPQGMAMFSTKLGRLKYKPARPNARCIIRSEYWEDVYDMAKQLQSEFPDHCNSMTQREVQNLDNYFDPLDIQMNSRPFLVHVLELIVCWNLLASIHEVEEFAQNWIDANPEAFEQLNFNATVMDVFDEYDIQSKGKDLLDSALNQLVKWKYPEGWAIVVEDYHAKMAQSGKHNSYSQPSWATANPPFQEQPQDAPVPQRAASDPVVNVSEMSKPNMSLVTSGPPTAGPYPNFSQHSAPGDQRRPPAGYGPVPLVASGHFRPEMTYGALTSFPNPIGPAPIQLQPPPVGQQTMALPIQSLAQMPYGKPLAAPNEVLEQMHPGFTSRGDYHSDPVPASWQEKEGYSKNVYAVPSRGRPGPFQLQRVPLSARQRGLRAAALPKGVRNPPKRISDDIRNQTNALSFARRPSEPDQVKWVPVQQANFPIDLMQPPSRAPLVPSRTSSIGPGAPFMPAYTMPFRQFSGSVDNQGYDQGIRQGIEGPDPRSDPNFHPGRFEDMRLRQVHEPIRMVSNPFPTTTPSALPYPEPDLSRVPQSVEIPPTANPSSRMQSNPDFRPFVQQLNPHTFERSLHRPNPSSMLDRPPRSRDQQTIMPHPQVSSEHVPNHGPQSHFKRGQPCDKVLYIAGFPSSYSLADVRSLLRPCRGLTEVSEPRLSKGESDPAVLFVFATFESVELAEEALRLLPNTRFRELNGNSLVVSPRISREDFDHRRTPKKYGDQRRPTTWKSMQECPIQKTGHLPTTATEQTSEQKPLQLDQQQSTTVTSKPSDSVPRNQVTAKDFQGVPKQERVASAMAAKEPENSDKHHEVDRTDDPRKAKCKIQEYGVPRLDLSSQPVSPKVFDRAVGQSAQVSCVPKPGQDRLRNMSPEQAVGPASTSTGSPIRKKKNHHKGKDFRIPRLRQTSKPENSAGLSSSIEKSSQEQIGNSTKQESETKLEKAGQKYTPKTPPSQSKASCSTGLELNSSNRDKHSPPTAADQSIPTQLGGEHHSQRKAKLATVSSSQGILKDSDTQMDKMATTNKSNVEAKTRFGKSEHQMNTNDLPKPGVSDTVSLSADSLELKKQTNEWQKPHEEKVIGRGDKTTSAQPKAAFQVQTDSKEPAGTSRASSAIKETSKVAVPLPPKTKDSTAVSDIATQGKSFDGLGTTCDFATASTTPPSRPPKEYAGNAAVGGSDHRHQDQKSKVKSAKKLESHSIDPKILQNKLEAVNARQVTPGRLESPPQSLLDNAPVVHTQDAPSSKSDRKQSVAKPEIRVPGLSERVVDLDFRTPTETKDTAGQATSKASEQLTKGKKDSSERQDISRKTADKSNGGKGSSANGTEQIEGPSIPPRSSSLSQPPTPEPIITRKKKQKSFGTVAENKTDRPTSETVNSKQTEDESQGKCISAPPAEIKSEESFQNVEAQQTIGNKSSQEPSTEMTVVAKKKSKNKKSKKPKSSRNVSIELEKPHQAEPQRPLPEPETPYLVDAPSPWQTWTNSRMNPSSKVPSSTESSDTPMDDDMNALDWYYQEKNKHLKELQKGMRFTSPDDFDMPREYENAILIQRQAKFKTQEQLQEQFTEAFREAGYAKTSSSERFKSDDPQLARIDRLFEERDKSRGEEISTEEREPQRLLIPYTKNGKGTVLVADGPEQLMAAIQAKKMIEDAQAMRRLEMEKSQVSETRSPNHGDGSKGSEDLEGEIDRIAAEQTLASIHDQDHKPGEPSPIREERIEKCQRLLGLSPRRNAGKSKTLPPEQWDRQAAALLAEIPRLSSEEVTRLNYLINRPAIVRRGLVTDLGITPADIINYHDRTDESLQEEEEASSKHSKAAAMAKAEDLERNGRTEGLSTEQDDELNIGQNSSGRITLRPAASRLKEETDFAVNAEDSELSGAFASQVDEVSAALAANEMAEIPPSGSKSSDKCTYNPREVSADTPAKQTSDVHLQNQETEASPKPAPSKTKRDLFSSMMGKPSKERDNRTGSCSTSSTEHLPQPHLCMDPQTSSIGAKILENQDPPFRIESAQLGSSETMKSTDEVKTHDSIGVDNPEDAKHSRKLSESISSTNSQEPYRTSVRGGGIENALVNLDEPRPTEDLSDDGEPPSNASTASLEKVLTKTASNASATIPGSDVDASNGPEEIEPEDGNDDAYRSRVLHSLSSAVSTTPSASSLRAPSFSSVLASAGEQTSNSSAYIVSSSDSMRGSFEARKGGFRGGPRGKAHAHSRSDPWALPGEEGQWGGERGRNSGEAFVGALARGERRASGSGVNSSPCRVRRGGSLEG